MSLQDYVNFGKIGKGVSGDVIKVFHIPTQTFRICKRIPTSFINHPDQRKKEVHILQRMKSPFVVQYLEHFYDENYTYIIMEHCQNGDLRHLLEAHKKKQSYFEEIDVLKCFVHALLALEFVHRNQVIHRDVKPENLLFSKDFLKLGDFGFSIQLQQPTDKATSLVGSPWYDSPEKILGKPYSSKTDIWSLGVLMYEMVSLQYPFPANVQFDIMDKIVTKPAPPFPDDSLPQPRYSRRLKDLISLMLTKDPALRPSAAELLFDPFIVNAIAQMNITQQAQLEAIRHSASFTSFPTKTSSGIAENLNEMQKGSLVKTQMGDFSPPLHDNEAQHLQLDGNQRSLANAPQKRILPTSAPAAPEKAQMAAPAVYPMLPVADSAALSNAAQATPSPELSSSIATLEQPSSSIGSFPSPSFLSSSASVSQTDQESSFISHVLPASPYCFSERSSSIPASPYSSIIAQTHEQLITGSHDSSTISLASSYASSSANDLMSQTYASSSRTTALLSPSFEETNSSQSSFDSVVQMQSAKESPVAERKREAMNEEQLAYNPIFQASTIYAQCLDAASVLFTSKTAMRMSPISNDPTMIHVDQSIKEQLEQAELKGKRELKDKEHAEMEKGAMDGAAELHEVEEDDDLFETEVLYVTPSFLSDVEIPHDISDHPLVVKELSSVLRRVNKSRDKIRMAEENKETCLNLLSHLTKHALQSPLRAFNIISHNFLNISVRFMQIGDNKSQEHFNEDDDESFVHKHDEQKECTPSFVFPVEVISSVCHLIAVIVHHSSEFTQFVLATPQMLQSILTAIAVIISKIIRISKRLSSATQSSESNLQEADELLRYYSSALLSIVDLLFAISSGAYSHLKTIISESISFNSSLLDSSLKEKKSEEKSGKFHLIALMIRILAIDFAKRAAEMLEKKRKSLKEQKANAQTDQSQTDHLEDFKETNEPAYYMQSQSSKESSKSASSVMNLSSSSAAAYDKTFLRGKNAMIPHFLVQRILELIEHFFQQSKEFVLDAVFLELSMQVEKADGVGILEAIVDTYYDSTFECVRGPSSDSTENEKPSASSASQNEVKDEQNSNLIDGEGIYISAIFCLVFTKAKINNDFSFALPQLKNIIAHHNVKSLFLRQTKGANFKQEFSAKETNRFVRCLWAVYALSSSINKIRKTLVEVGLAPLLLDVVRHSPLSEAVNCSLMILSQLGWNLEENTAVLIDEGIFVVIYRVLLNYWKRHSHAFDSAIEKLETKEKENKSNEKDIEESKNEKSLKEKDVDKTKDIECEITDDVFITAIQATQNLLYKSLAISVTAARQIELDKLLDNIAFTIRRLMIEEHKEVDFSDEDEEFGENRSQSPVEQLIIPIDVAKQMEIVKWATYSLDWMELEQK
ncbi:putative plant dual-specificity MAP kinase kinase family domain protein [Monocercomonoides exilis]|uniref:putative plant dual-specificity MAP kinase kinase family domain protein n=1 Tax=Monocercomonoides exilis TaxID=2049356 RepID=UPI003559AC9D|nr:putative plant dual-specificity MAP kinase kinase family domain protein [Monocercomonoides exilis]|eukprot:MONOS_12230.1-p1 / transcript=MONOS_12230.1 / gene=MONOS_12230 / organism=Monocercomonoides_exilis_PA203 / gene_product=plant dual-specificity MAP kinase kinase family domain protein / transcript_product=plant dual-specificity MAP kinase kinase family domain protein / location=Mono_scaffold00662:29482-34234(-) / protein_length=1377 / sequence_SO=supercontig / SO=protein_coding / is_pseudo=false